jgi:hypothetical protein
MYYLAAHFNALVREIAVLEFPLLVLLCFTGHIQVVVRLPVLYIYFYQDINEHDIQPLTGIRINPRWTLSQALTLFIFQPPLMESQCRWICFDKYDSLIQLYPPTPFVRSTPPPAPKTSKCTSRHSLTRANLLFDYASNRFLAFVLTRDLNQFGVHKRSK